MGVVEDDNTKHLGLSTKHFIRSAEDADVVHLQELGRLGWETTYSGFIRPENRATYLAGAFWSVAQLREVIADPACLALVAEGAEGRVDGFATYEPMPD